MITEGKGVFFIEKVKHKKKTKIYNKQDKKLPLCLSMFADP
jgi:hypothetical protein